MKIEFIAVLPSIQSAIQIDGRGDGGRIKLDISRQFTPELLKLQVLTGKNLKVTIQEEFQKKHSSQDESADPYFNPT